jgi:F0F1-type ATP synthase assembly protein I
MTGNSPRGSAGGGPQGGENPGWTIFSYLLAGMGVYGGIGWLIGRWVGNPPAFLAIGMVVGLVLAIALTIFRYGRYSAGGPGGRSSRQH